MESSTAPDEARQLRTHIQPLPRTVDEIVALFKRVVLLPDTQEVRVTPEEFSVRRVVAEGDDVIPKLEGPQQVDLEFVLKRVDLSSLPFDPGRHPYMSLEKATRMLMAYRVKPTFVVAESGEMLSAFLALDDPRPTNLFGMPVVYDNHEMFEDKVLILGGSTPLLTDVTHGIIIDMGA